MMKGEKKDMTVKQCYEAMEANYEEVESRLRTEEKLKNFT